ncbi:MAG: ASCH domain-containing protein, partial [Desulfurococcales archaeon]|nr:ASCH domain-containing protein [Desulfurococcales archaeon]
MPVYLRRHIMMRGEYARLLLSGRKKATIRLGKVIPKYDEVIIHSWGRPIAKAKIVKVVYKRIRELTNEDAWKDGFKTRDELLRELRRVYGGFNDN